MKLVGYVRVSSDSQEDNTSLRDQENKIKAYCDAFGHELIMVFSEVGSGSQMNTRPEFNKAMDVVASAADGIIATKLDRIARNCKDVLSMVEDVLQPNNKALILLDLNVDTTNPIGKMILTVMAAVAELERAQINERTQGGRKAKSKDGGYAYGSPAYGKKSSEERELVDNEEELKVIEIIIDKRLSGMSLRDIATYLNDNNYVSKRGKPWIHTSVKSVLDKNLKKT